MYSVIRRDRSSTGKVRGDDVAIFIDDELSAIWQSDLEHATLEHIVLEIHLGGKRDPCQVICVYILSKEAVHILETLLTVLE